MTRSTNRICGRIKKYDNIDETREDNREKTLSKEWAKKMVDEAIAQNPLVFHRLADI